MVNNKPKKNPVNYNCEKCTFITSNKKDFNRHLLTRKHKILNSDNEISHKLGHTCGQCNKFYKYLSGLSRHKKICNVQKPPPNSDNMLDEQKKIIGSVIKKTSELIIENHELTKQLFEKIKQIQSEKYDSNIPNNINVYLFVSGDKYYEQEL
tara:strand:+ start:3615 stop:4070 length:456 start_codon:yes stop_codon:yes gene_type:complete